jgi:phosphoglycolate phosphatase
MRLAIFDLDGTLVDSKQDLCNSVNATRQHMGLPRLPDELVASYVGNGAPVLIQRAMPTGTPQETLDQALAFFLAWYREHMLDFTRDYPGVREALAALKTGGVAMAVLTNKPVRFSRDLIAGLGLKDYFFQIYGGNSFEQKKPHPYGVHKLVEEAGAELDSTWMVGDSAVDVLTARNAGIRCCGVTFGLQPDSLRDNPPDLLVDDLRDFPPHILP